jgi:aminoglycoside phosphotransferase (APT) family kinase protein
MSQPWLAESSLSHELAASLIQKQFPQLEPNHVEILGTGWDNLAFLVNEKFVFRFPRRQLGAECLEHETRVLPSLVSRLPLPIPYPEYIGAATERFPWMFAGYRHLQGRTACGLAMNDAQRISTAPALAMFLAALHALPVEWGLRIRAPRDTMGRLDPGRRIPQAKQRIENVFRMGWITDARPYHDLIEKTATARPPQAMALVHGDFYVRHLLVDHQARPTGVIDWGDVHVGDIALDLSIALTFLPPAGHDEFRRAYGPIDEATWSLARFRALSYGLILTEYGHSVSDADLIREGRFILGNVLEH